MFEITIIPDPEIALLNIKPDYMTRKQFKLFIQLMTAAKQTITKAWKTPLLNIAETKHRMNRSLLHAKMEALDKENLKGYEGLWKPWITHCLPINFDHQVLQSW